MKCKSPFEMQITFRIFRFDPLEDASPRFEDFPYEVRGKESVLEALLQIRNEQDSTLAFRYSCREAICGACAMVINGKFDLACRTLLDSSSPSLIVIEPLPNLEIQKDLLVDMEPFWKALEKIEWHLQPREEGAPPGGGREVGVEAMEEIEQFISCVLCGCCWSACPVVSRDERYPGPAALAKLYRFVKDPRDARPFSSWSRINTETGVWGCDTIFACNEACPKGVRPADGIAGLRRKLLVEKIKRLFRRKG